MLIDKGLVAKFKDDILELKKRGYSDLDIRASFHDAAPKLLWQEKLYIGMMNGAATTFGISLVIVAIIFSIFLEPSIKIPVIFIIFFTGALIYYFALGAFLFHAGHKLFLTGALSLILSGISWIILQAFEKFVVVATPALATIQDTAIKLNELPQALVGSDLPIETITQITGNLDPALLSHTIEFTTLFAIILVAYNITPVFFFMREHIAFVVKKEEKEYEDH